MTVLSYRVTLLEPALVTALEGDPNSAVAFDYLPGSALRGAIIGAYLRQQKQSELDAANPAVRRLFFDGATRFLNAYPLDRQNRRSLPTPQSWHREKGALEQDPVFDFAVQEEVSLEQPQGVKNPFCTLTDNGKVRCLKPDHHIAVHTFRDRHKGRPGRDLGAVYRYDALAPDQTLGGAILCDAASDAATLRTLLEDQDEVSVGGSRSAGYGRVRFHHLVEETDWREVKPGVEPESTVSDSLIVTLLSDALLRDGNGQFTVAPEVVTAALSQRLGVHLPCPQSFLRGNEVGGFNRRWGLPLPQALAVQMGSVFVYPWPEGLTTAAVKGLEWQGIGERRAEGLGRIGVNWHTGPKWEVEGPTESEKPQPVDLTGDAVALRLAQQMAERLLRQRLDRALASRANELGPHVQQPSNSQLSRLRSIVREALQQPLNQGRTRLGNYLRSLEERQSTRKQFTRDRIEGELLLDWLRRRVGDEQQIWSDLDAADDRDLPTIGTVPAKLGPELAYEYNLRLMDAVLARAAKERGKENSNG